MNLKKPLAAVLVVTIIAYLVRQRTGSHVDDSQN